MPIRFKLTWVLVSLAFGILINEINLRIVVSENPGNVERNAKSTVYGFTIWSPDNSYYVPPIKNLLAGRGYVIDPGNPKTRVRRTPVYPLFYGLHYVLFGERGSFLAIRYSQSALHALSVVLLGLAVLHLTSDQPLARLTTILFAFSPFTWIYCYYTLTPSLYPFVLVLTIYVFARALAKGAQSSLLFLAGALTGLVVLTRPVTGVLLPTLLVSLWFHARGSGVGRRTVLSGAWAVVGGFALCLAPWVTRNYVVTNGRFVPLEEYSDQQGLGDDFEAFRRWWFAWDHRPDTPSEYGKGVLELLGSDSPARHVARAEETAARLPEYALAGTTRAEVRNALVELGECFRQKLAAAVRTQRSEADPHLRAFFQLANPPPCTRPAAERFEDLTRRFTQANPLRYYVITPLMVMRGLMFQSHSFAFGSLNPDDGRLSPWQFTIKTIMYLLNVSLFAGALAAPFLRVLSAPLKALVVVYPWLMLGFLAEFFRLGVSATYLAAVIPLFYVALAGLLLEHNAHLSPKIHAQSKLSSSRSDERTPPAGLFITTVTAAFAGHLAPWSRCQPFHVRYTREHHSRISGVRTCLSVGATMPPQRVPFPKGNP